MSWSIYRIFSLYRNLSGEKINSQKVVREIIFMVLMMVSSSFVRQTSAFLSTMGTFQQTQGWPRDSGFLRFSVSKVFCHILSSGCLLQIPWDVSLLVRFLAHALLNFDYNNQTPNQISLSKKGFLRRITLIEINMTKLKVNWN